MKLVIDIPDAIKEMADEGDKKIIHMMWMLILIDAIKNGIVLPKGHGRLIDADDYKKKVCTYQQTGCGDCKHSLCCPEHVPTIIEADKESAE